MLSEIDFRKNIAKMKAALWPQWLATFEVFLMALMVGFAIGWISPTLGRLSRPDPPFEATKDQVTWVASLISISQAVGAVTAIITTPLIGSKVVVYLCGFIFFTAWVFLLYANSINMVFVSLILSGIGMGKLYTSYPVYIGEISDPRIRGRLVSLVVHGLMVGSLSGNIMGACLQPWVFAAVNLVPNFIFLITFPFIPNTPHYFVRRNKIEKAAKSLQWYNRSGDVQKDLESLSGFLEANPQLAFFKTLGKINTRVNRKILIILNVLFCLLQFGGIYTLLAYMELMFIHAKITAVVPSSLVTVLSLLGVPASWISIYTSDKYGRTTILLASCTILALALFAWGVNYHLLDLGYNSENLQWIIIVSVLIYRMAVVIGIFTMIPTLMSEMFAPNVKSICNCVCLINFSVSTFISQKYFLFMIDVMTIKYVFYLLSGLTFVSGLYAKIFIPETKGKSLQEIQAILNKTKQSKEVELTLESRLISKQGS